MTMTPPRGLGVKRTVRQVDVRRMRWRRRGLSAFLLIVSLAALVPVVQSTPADAFAGAPWFEPSKPYAQNFPDPNVVRDGSTYYAYSTTTGGSYVPAMSSTDLATWTARPAYNPGSFGSCVGAYDQYFNDSLPCPASWAVRDPGTAHLRTEVWAPGVAKIGGKWRMFYVAKVRNSPLRQCISVAWSDSPLGPFRDDSTGALQCDSDPGGSIDPEPFVDSNGTPYLVWKSEGIIGSTPQRIWSRQLTADGMGFAPGSNQNLLLATQDPWEGSVVENPSMTRTPQGKLWLTYSGNLWNSPSYAAGVASCVSPAGPCGRVSATPMLSSTGAQNGPGATSFFTDTSGRLRIAYQAWNAPYSSYPAYPQCATNNTCDKQGQRFLHIGGVVDYGGRLTSDPIGSLDSATVAGGTVTLSGWAMEPDLVDKPASILLLVDNNLVGGTTANQARADVGSAFGYGNNHGFSASVALSAGTHQVCTAMFNSEGGTGAAWRNCKTVTSAGPGGSNPFGALDSATAAGPGTVALKGWAIDADAGTGPVAVQVLIDGNPAGAPVAADGPRPDLTPVFGLGPNHGYTATVTGLVGGTHAACVRVQNSGGGTDTIIGCKSVQMPSGDPFGALDQAATSPGGMRVTGWAIDPDTASAIDVHVYVDGSFKAAATANASRPDVGAFFAGYGNNHGYNIQIGGLTPGNHNVCTYAINSGAGTNKLIACKTAAAGAGSPFGSFDTLVRSAGGVRITGWTIDPDTASATDVHVYIDNVYRGTVTANASRPDVGAFFAGYGNNHGIDTVVPSVSSGPHTVCVFGINVASGANSVIGCRSIS